MPGELTLEEHLVFDRFIKLSSHQAFTNNLFRHVCPQLPLHVKETRGKDSKQVWSLPIDRRQQLLVITSRANPRRNLEQLIKTSPGE